MNALDKLIACAGNWRGSNRLQDPHTNAPEDSPATASIAALLDGRFVRLDYTWGYQGKPQEGSLLIGYEPKTGMASAYWIDTWHMGRQVMAAEGSISQNGEISVLGSFAVPPGPDWGWRTVITPSDGITPEDGQQLQITMFNISPEGLEELAVEASYSRE